MALFTYKCEQKSRTKLKREKIEKNNFGGFLPVKMMVKIFNLRFEKVRNADSAWPARNSIKYKLWPVKFYPGQANKKWRMAKTELFKKKHTFFRLRIHQMTKKISSNLSKNYLFCLSKFCCGHALAVFNRKTIKIYLLFIEFKARKQSFLERFSDH